MKIKENVHAGHRQRLKEKVRNFGLKSLGKHEVLELLLTYTIPYKDTNELAHRLINECNGFSNVFHADFNFLTNIPGVGRETALFLNLVPELFEIYKADKESNVVFLHNINDCVSYFRRNYEIKTYEMMYIVFLSGTDKLNRVIEIKGGDDCSINFDLKMITSHISNTQSKSIVIFHTHPKGLTNPSQHDIDATTTICTMCEMLGVNLFDHIIFNETEYYSFGANNLLDKIKEDVWFRLGRSNRQQAKVAQTDRIPNKHSLSKAKRTKE